MPEIKFDLRLERLLEKKENEIKSLIFSFCAKEPEIIQVIAKNFWDKLGTK